MARSKRKLQLKNKRFLDLLVALTLSLGIFPSLVALSGSFAFRLSGPINPLKLTAPLLIFYVWKKRQRLPLDFWKKALLIWAVFALGTLSGCIVCDFPTAFIREFAVMTLGMVAALSFLFLPTFHARLVVSAWLLTVITFMSIDLFFPSAIDTFHHTLFDPLTREWDKKELGHRVLGGIWGRQALAKFLALLPWLFFLGFHTLSLSSLPQAFQRQWKSLSLGASLQDKHRILFMGALTALCAGPILLTSQRGPLIGLLLGWIAFALHQAWVLKKRKTAFFGILAIFLTVGATLIIVPQNRIRERLQGFQDLLLDDRPMKEKADSGIRFRVQRWKLAAVEISENPFGKPCLNERRAWKYTISPTHAHNLFAEQFRSRGWIWGTLHLLLWLLSLAGAWRLRSLTGSILLGGITTIIGLGMFDHPWFVLNQAMLLGIFFLAGLLHWQLRQDPRSRSLKTCYNEVK